MIEYNSTFENLLYINTSDYSNEYGRYY